MRNLFYSMLVVVATATFLSCSESEDEETISFPDGDEIRVEECDDLFSLTLPVGDYVVNGKKVKSGYIDYFEALGVDGPPYLIQGAKGTITSVTGMNEGRIDVTKCPALERLNVTGLNGVNASNCLNLNYVRVHHTYNVAALNFSGCTNLSDIEITGQCEVDVLNLSRSGITEFLFLEGYVGSCNLLDFSECPKLKRVDLENCNLEDAEVSFKGCTALTSFRGSNYTASGPYDYVFKHYRNETLDFSGCTSLDTVDCEYFLPRNLILDGCTSLRYLDCSDSYVYNCDYQLATPFDTLDLRTCPALTYLNCSYIGLTSLDISENKNLRAISCYGNNFSIEEINKIYEDLPVVEDGWIEVDEDNSLYRPIGNYEIAESKGWRVSFRRIN